jgi:hypothetical protein
VQRRALLLIAPLLLGLTACEPNVLVGAGDIADCSESADTATAQLVDGIRGEVFAAGDNAYEQGTLAEYQECWRPTWGRHDDRIHPAPGNHEYETSGASGYFNYFGSKAGPAGRGYYFFDKGPWRIFSLNSEVNIAESATFVRNNAGGKRCIAAIWHRPYRDSFANDGSVSELWRAVYDVGGDLVINGHRHHYERFGLLDRGGAPVSSGERGMREIVVGTGGADLTGFRTVQPGSEVRQSSHHGVLRVELRDGAYVWEFHRVGGGIGDSGFDAC